MARHYDYGAGDWEDITPLERKKNQELASFLFKAPLINRVQRVFLWPLDKVHSVLAEYIRFLVLKEESLQFTFQKHRFLERFCILLSDKE